MIARAVSTCILPQARSIGSKVLPSKVVVARTRLHESWTTECGDLRRVFIGVRSHAKITPGYKWSTIENYAICGPYSMLNHACERHANVDTDFKSSNLWAIRAIEPSEELLVEYASEVYLRHTVPWIECLRCIDGSIQLTQHHTVRTSLVNRTQQQHKLQQQLSRGKTK